MKFTVKRMYNDDNIFFHGQFIAIDAIDCSVTHPESFAGYLTDRLGKMQSIMNERGWGATVSEWGRIDREWKGQQPFIHAIASLRYDENEMVYVVIE